MRLTAFTDYSLRVLVYLAAQPGRRATIAEVAQAFDISEHHLTKVVHFLGREGWLRNVRGHGGGLELGAAPADICIGEVIRRCETPAVAECFDTERNRCVITPVCQLKHALAKANAAWFAALDRYSLADVTTNRKSLAKVLQIQPI